MNDRPVTTSRRSREQLREELARQVESAEQKLTLLQHTAHAALRAESASDVRHWLGQAGRASELVGEAALEVAVKIGWLESLFPEAHADGEKVPGRPARCACGRVAATCNARLQLEVGAFQWVDERGRLRHVSEAGSEAIPAGQR